MVSASLLLPEFLALLGIGVFVVTSLLTGLLDKHFPRFVPFIYQGQLLPVLVISWSAGISCLYLTIICGYVTVSSI